MCHSQQAHLSFYHSHQVARLQEENRELKGKVKSLADSNGGIPLDLSREFEQRVKRLEAELEVCEDQRRKAAQEVVKLQSQLSESQHAAKGHKEVLVNEVCATACILIHNLQNRRYNFFMCFSGERRYVRVTRDGGGWRSAPPIARH